MLDELAALLVTRPRAAQAPGCLPEGQATLWDPTSMAPLVHVGPRVTSIVSRAGHIGGRCGANGGGLALP
jgi:hypothetical protein